jgi:DNA-binding response OmpR family regulator
VHEHQPRRDRDRHQKSEVRRAGRLLDLSAREFCCHTPGARTKTSRELLNEVWGYRSMPSTRMVDVHVAWLRQKIEAARSIRGTS